MGSSQTRARTRVPCIGRQILNHCATREALAYFSTLSEQKNVTCCISKKKKDVPAIRPSATAAASLGILAAKSKLILLTARQANKLRDELWGQGIATLFRKPADRENGGLMSQRTILSELEFRLLLY